MLRQCSVCKRDLPRDAFYACHLLRNVSPCKECVKARTARLYAYYRINHSCWDCGKKVRGDRSRCPSCAKNQRGKYHQNGDRNRQLSRDRHYKDKVAAFEAYGGAICRCCGETEFYFLSIDHINGDGAAHRKQIAGNRKSSYKTCAGHQTYLWLRLNNYPPGFQVLCMNCNFAKGHFGECPHQRKTLQIVK
jgi:hypothetical protein